MACDPDDDLPRKRPPRRRTPGEGVPSAGATPARKRYPGPHVIDGTAQRIAGQIEEERLQHGPGNEPGD